MKLILKIILQYVLSIFSYQSNGAEARQHSADQNLITHRRSLSL